MNELQKEILLSYLKGDDIDILAINFLKGGNISKDTLTVHYYKKDGKQWYLNTDQVSQTGEVSTRSVKTIR